MVRRAGAKGDCAGSKKQDPEPQGRESRWSHGPVPNFAGSRGGRLWSAPRRGGVSGAAASHAPEAVSYQLPAIPGKSLNLREPPFPRSEVGALIPTLVGP